MARRSSGTKGYTGYRGRRRGRGVLAAVLVVILLLACGFLFAQRYMVYDADGSVRFEFPWIKKTPQDDTANGGDSGDDKEQDDLEITVQKPVIKDTYAVELGADALGSDWQAALDGLDKDVNAVAVELKDASGKIHYGSKVQGAIDCGAVAGGSASDTAIQGLVDSDYYTIGRISTLHDSLYAYEHMTDAAVCQLTGFVWYDTNSTHWLAPEKQAFGGYLAAGEDGNWYYYVDGVIDTSYTGEATNEYGKWYVVNGKVDFSHKFGGYLAEGEDGNWYYYVDGVIDTSYTGEATNQYGTWYVVNGKVDFSHKF